MRTGLFSEVSSLVFYDQLMNLDPLSAPSAAMLSVGASVLLAISPIGALSQEGFKSLGDELDGLAKRGEVIGLQVAIRDSSGILYSGKFGTVSAGSEKKVDAETLFLVASCSKPFASACALSLIADGDIPIQLDDPISRWIPAYGSVMVKGGGLAARSPTVEELLSHRAGIYSQKSRMTLRESKWIRDFRLSLEESVDGIALSSLSANPGSAYAYSGAGYCLLGRVAELVTEKSFELLLQERVCRPLGMTRTTYFPAVKFPLDEIATGVPEKMSPHRLGQNHRLPLIGGSLYTTAEEMTLFGIAISEGWKGNGTHFLGVPKEMIRDAGNPRSKQSQYGLGWKVMKRNGETIRLSHSGSLGSHRAWLAVDLEKGVSVAGCWTLPGSRAQAAVIPVLQHSIQRD